MGFEPVPAAQLVTGDYVHNLWGDEVQILSTYADVVITADGYRSARVVINLANGDRYDLAPMAAVLRRKP